MSIKTETEKKTKNAQNIYLISLPEWNVRARFDCDVLRLFIIITYTKRARTNTCRNDDNNLLLLLFSGVASARASICIFAFFPDFIFMPTIKQRTAKSDNIIYIAGHI